MAVFFILCYNEIILKMLEIISGENLIYLVRAFGYLGVFGIVFAESGLFFGFFLPGDSLLFTVGFLSSQGYLNIVTSLLVIFFAAVLGDNFGYAFGRKIGCRMEI